ncbi:hypothetical protein GVAV_001194 [Gurleya vavrai]
MKILIFCILVAVPTSIFYFLKKYREKTFYIITNYNPNEVEHLGFLANHFFYSILKDNVFINNLLISKNKKLKIDSIYVDFLVNNIKSRNFEKIGNPLFCSVFDNNYKCKMHIEDETSSFINFYCSDSILKFLIYLLKIKKLKKEIIILKLYYHFIMYIKAKKFCCLCFLQLYFLEYFENSNLLDKKDFEIFKTKKKFLIFSIDNNNNFSLNDIISSEKTEKKKFNLFQKYILKNCTANFNIYTYFNSFFNAFFDVNKNMKNQLEIFCKNLICNEDLYFKSLNNFKKEFCSETTILNFLQPDINTEKSFIEFFKFLHDPKIMNFYIYMIKSIHKIKYETDFINNFWKISFCKYDKKFNSILENKNYKNQLRELDSHPEFVKFLIN